MNHQLPLILVAAALFGGCSPERRVEEVEPGRTVDDRSPKLGASSQERFGGQRQAAAAPQRAPAKDFTYRLPAGWEELPAKQFRNVNLGAPGGVNAWVTLMAAGAGGALGNLTRWRGQLGLPPATEADLQALPGVPLLGEDAKQVDLTAADGSVRLVAVALFAKDRSVFVRMNGPTDAVGAQLDAFNAFCSSLTDAGTSAPAATPTQPAGGNTAGGADGAGDFRWTVPAGWDAVGASQFKLFEFRAGDTNCWLSELAGDGGGFAANINRWCGQVGRPQLSPDELAALPRLDVLGESAAYVALLADDTADGLLGVVVPLDGRTLFIKMAGPSDQLRAHQPEFEAFCRSLTRKG